jgi:hypothetical protein
MVPILIMYICGLAASASIFVLKSIPSFGEAIHGQKDLARGLHHLKAQRGSIMSFFVGGKGDEMYGCSIAIGSPGQL